jgi:uncharacterized protein (DUF4415 family)
MGGQARSDSRSPRPAARGVAKGLSRTIRLDADILAAFREKGEGWQTRVNAALREWLEHQ